MNPLAHTYSLAPPRGVRMPSKECWASFDSLTYTGVRNHMRHSQATSQTLQPTCGSQRCPRHAIVVVPTHTAAAAHRLVGVVMRPYVIIRPYVTPAVDPCD